MDSPGLRGNDRGGEPRRRLFPPPPGWAGSGLAPLPGNRLLPASLAGVACSDVRRARCTSGPRGFCQLRAGRPGRPRMGPWPGLAHVGASRLAAAAWAGWLWRPWPGHRLEVHSRVSPFHALGRGPRRLPCFPRGWSPAAFGSAEMMDAERCVWVGQTRHNYRAVQLLVGAQPVLLSDRPSISFSVFVTGSCAAAFVGPSMTFSLHCLLLFTWFLLVPWFTLLNSATCLCSGFFCS